MKKASLLLLIVGSFGLLPAQNLSTHYLYQLNWLNINPAYTGETKGLQLIFNPGTQMVGMDGNPTSSMIGLHGQVGNNVGLGGKVVIDQRGAFTNLTTELLYSYKVRLSEQHRLNFGVSAGAFHTSINQSAVVNGRNTDLTDPVFTSDFYNTTHFLASFGALYQWKELQLGVSLPHMVVSGAPISDHIFGTARYDFYTKNREFEISPLLVYQQLPESPDLLDVGARIEWSNTLWTQLTYRSNETFGTGLGVNIQGFTVGYLYNINTGPLNEIAGGSHQVFLTFTFNPKKNKEKMDGNQRLNMVITELKQLTKTSRENPEFQAEVNDIQTQLAALLEKLNDGNFTEDDDRKLEELEERILRLKKEYPNNE